jgi:hypothetical protein
MKTFSSHCRFVDYRLDILGDVRTDLIGRSG